MVVRLLLLGVECPQERAFIGSLGAAEGARRFGESITAALYDAGAGRTAVASAPSDADANSLLTTVKEAAAEESGLLLVYLGGQFTWDVRRRRAVLVTADSARDNAHARGLAWEWVVSALAQRAKDGRGEALLVVDAAVGAEAWTASREGAAFVGDSPLWGRLRPYAPSRWGRVEGEQHAGGLSRLLAGALAEGLPGLPAVLDPVSLHPTLAARDEAAATWLGPPADSRLLLRNRAVLRGALRGPRSDR
ncbi:hypothetical protein [Streptacidiphilus sp. EB129]|uniref:hypothetical protein n=1 Tax=Streptacidiphilus sp. EB129 TaxID=3156262 RepID=UPI003519509B